MRKNVFGIILALFIVCPFTVNADEVNNIESTYSTLNGWVTEGGYTYYYVNGVKQTGFQVIDGNTYFFSRINNNEMRTGIFTIDGDVYYFDNNGVMQTGWYEKSGNKYYFDDIILMQMEKEQVVLEQ